MCALLHSNIDESILVYSSADTANWLNGCFRGMEEQTVSMGDFRARVQDPSATSETDQHLYREGAKGDLRMGTNLEWVQASQGTPGTPRPGQRQHRHINRSVGVYIYICRCALHTCECQQGGSAIASLVEA